MLEATDHDLLIKLDTRFDSFEKSVIKFMDNFNDKMGDVLDELKQKASREDITKLEAKLLLIEHRVNNVENEKVKSDAKKQLVVDFGSVGLKGWTLMIMIFGVIIALLNYLKR